MNPLQIAAALQTIAQAGLTTAQIGSLLRTDVTPEDVKAQLDKTDATLARLKADDAPIG